MFRPRTDMARPMSTVRPANDNRPQGIPGIALPSDAGFATFEEAQRDSMGIEIDEDCFDVPGFDPDNITFADGVHWYKTPSGEKIVLAHMVPTLEWCLPSPPMQHSFDESPVIYDATTDPDWYTMRDAARGKQDK